MIDYGRFRSILAERQDHVLILTLNRPERLNAVGDDMHEGLEAILTDLRNDPSVRAVVLQAAGRAFCVGGDVKSFGEEPQTEMTPYETMQVVTRSAAHLIECFINTPQPLIGAVQGYAMGLGATLALMCDVLLVAEDAQIADTHVPVGLVAGDGGALAWPLAMPFNTAKYYLMTGERINAQDAVRLGLALKAVAPDELQAQALNMAVKMAQLPPLAVQGTKRALNQILRHHSQLTLDMGLQLEAATFLSKDHKEAVSAFMEKRSATFAGR
ncbi:enoyl-CoA hydratase/isomerase family protein [Pseudomonas sp. 5P_3.1_Bac2]|uniref:enoyl-CoA hydratase/isomerase family protein n=1 Tax=Pseudomonas sp. 5P_3.1_Bac2 TaxID=2971617 RepID=UPI0021C6F5FA|nr:enoyl-CoA hydratase/isomerase family protein [Pseudomonas sp. 5P_3.1_Bac2]MCU1717675.1 enoyl-CoA hydratase/isomerase family protein [Pseudomonas sp. 5P_3.1_Bac2]